MNKLEQAARQALEALEEIAATRYPSNWCEALHDEITALREALAEQAEQEPVAWTRKQFGEDREYCEEPFTTDWTPLYAAPVRTKDLTDDEIYPLYPEGPMCDKDMIDFARAVIAADRSKNAT